MEGLLSRQINKHILVSSYADSFGLKGHSTDATHVQFYSSWGVLLFLVRSFLKSDDDT